MKLKKLFITKLLPVILFVLVGFSTYGQKTITGTVTGTDGEAIPGVSVLVKGTTTGTMTDALGKYSIAVPNDATSLVFSYIGMKIQEKTISGDVVDCTLSFDETELSEVVVIGYGKVKKEDATGSVQTVSSADFNQGNITSPQELLVGKSAGVVITTSGGAPGSGATIRIRGGSSLNASNDPLIIIDGVPIDNNDVSGSSNLLSLINPNDIKTFTILKDASATAIYGNRASNGVIIITTKKGKLGSPLKISYNGNISVASAIKYMDVFSGDQLRKIAYDHKDLYSDESFNSLGSANTNWQKEIFRTAISQNHNVGITGSYKFLPYRVSFGYTDQNGILKNTDMQRMTGLINLNPSFLNNSLKVNINAKGMNTDNNFGDPGALGSAINMDPTQSVYDVDSLSGGYFQWENYGANLGTPNPVEQLLQADNKSNVKRFIGNIQLDYSVPYIKGLKANLNLATDYTESEGHNNRPATSPSVLTSPLWGRLSDYSGTNKNHLLEFYMNYQTNLENIKSKIDLTAGYSWQHFQRDGQSYTRGIVDENHPYQMQDSSVFVTENYLISFFGRLNYSLLDKYLFTFTLRDDGSSRFAEANRWGLFPSAAFAWKINEESFLKDVDIFSNLKLRLGWGITGQQDIGNDYPAQARFLLSSIGSYYPIDGVFLPTLRPNPYDPNIKWEETTTENIGLDFGLYKGRINGSVDLYKRVTDNLLNQVTIPTGSNFSNTLLTNVGSLENKGIEASLNFVPLSKKDMSLEFGINFTYNKNKITKLLISDDPDYIGILYGDAFTGKKQVTRVGYPAYSYFVNQQVYDTEGNPIEGLYVDLSGEGGSVNGNDADKYIYHNPVADYLFGFSFRFTYKDFDLSTSARVSIGNYVYNQVAAGASYDQMYQIGYWKNFPTALSKTNFIKRQFTSDYFVENASFLKVDYLSAGYNFKNIINKISGRVSFTVQNLLMLTKYSGLDPEVNGGIDNNFYPRPRTFLLGLSLTY
ncbi:MAG: TonB-dependent receptor [Chlorobi bacterium]|nr:TonB-dependent receptor [Chlorobiota bacterium]